MDSDEPILETQIKSYIIRNLNKEYHAYVTSIQRCQRQPSSMEFENLLASQEFLSRQMDGCFVSVGNGDILFTRNKKGHNKEEKKNRKKMESLLLMARESGRK